MELPVPGTGHWITISGQFGIFFVDKKKKIVIQGFSLFWPGDDREITLSRKDTYDCKTFTVF